MARVRPCSRARRDAQAGPPLRRAGPVARLTNASVGSAHRGCRRQGSRFRGGRRAGGRAIGRAAGLVMAVERIAAVLEVRGAAGGTRPGGTANLWGSLPIQRLWSPSSWYPSVPKSKLRRMSGREVVFVLPGFGFTEESPRRWCAPTPQVTPGVGHCPAWRTERRHVLCHATSGQPISSRKRPAPALLHRRVSLRPGIRLRCCRRCGNASVALPAIVCARGAGTAATHWPLTRYRTAAPRRRPGDPVRAKGSRRTPEGGRRSWTRASRSP